MIAGGDTPPPNEEKTHGPYCALCGQCRACTERGEQIDYGCYDSDDRKHLWNRG